MKVQKSKGKSQNYSEKGKTELKYRAYHFSLNVIKFVGSLPNKKLFWTIVDQLLRSATSIGANIVEAQSASSKRDFARFYGIALKIGKETKYWLCLLRDSEILENLDQVGELLDEAVEISKILASSLITLQGKRTF